MNSVAIYDTNSGKEKEVRLEGKTVFKIKVNGNGLFFAVNGGQYLRNGFRYQLTDYYANAEFFRDYSECEEACFNYIRHHETRIVGFIQVVK